jgi:hypothetical protein
MTKPAIAVLAIATADASAECGIASTYSTGTLARR